MRDPAFEDRIFCMILVEVDGVAISTGDGKCFYLGIADNAGKSARHAGFDVLNEQRAHKPPSQMRNKITQQCLSRPFIASHVE